jgi:cyclohexadienyl dehydratase
LLGGMLLALLSLAAPAALADRLQAIEAARQLRVCIWPDYYGISFRNPKTQQLSGIDIDNARALAHELKVDLRFVDSSFATRVDDVLAGLKSDGRLLVHARRHGLEPIVAR